MPGRWSRSLPALRPVLWSPAQSVQDIRGHYQTFAAVPRVLNYCHPYQAGLHDGNHRPVFPEQKTVRLSHSLVGGSIDGAVRAFNIL